MSAAPEFDFEMHAGDDKFLDVHVQDPDGNTVSLGGVTAIRWWFAKKVTSDPPLVQKSLSGGGLVIVGDPANGNLRISIEPDDTLTRKGDFYHELEVIDSAGDVATVLRGTLTVVRALIDPP